MRPRSTSAIWLLRTSALLAVSVIVAGCSSGLHADPGSYPLIDGAHSVRTLELSNEVVHGSTTYLAIQGPEGMGVEELITRQWELLETEGWTFVGGSDPGMTAVCSDERRIFWINFGSLRAVLGPSSRGPLQSRLGDLDRERTIVAILPAPGPPPAGEAEQTWVPCEKAHGKWAKRRDHFDANLQRMLRMSRPGADACEAHPDKMNPRVCKDRHPEKAGPAR